ncbi:MAG: DNA replication/repair protein RecF [Oscillospiraceae bacterium]
MVINSFEADGFRNLKNVRLKLHPGLNVLCGKNAQGKTNILEGIWLCTGERSFRNAKDKELFAIDKDGFRLGLEFTDRQRKQDISYTAARGEYKNKNIKLNGVDVKTPSGLFGSLNCVVFTPEDLFLSKGSPEVRRQFEDLAIAQIKVSYRKVVDQYKRLLEQRNAQLKVIAAGKATCESIEMWDVQLAHMGAYISVLRYNYCKSLDRVASALYNQISGGSESLRIEYGSTIYEDLEGRTDYNTNLAFDYYEKLDHTRNDDVRAGFTQIGIQRDDIHCYINGLYAKDYASQGQHRSVALCMKLAQAYILQEETHDFPCILLDDVLSELDFSRQCFVMNRIHDMQVIITCCDENIMRNIKSNGYFYRIENGRAFWMR